MKKNKCLLLFFLVTLLAGISSCTTKVVETTIQLDKDLDRILIAADSSEYKDEIINRLIDRYKSDYAIDLINIAKLKNLNVEPYKCILIIDTCMAWTRLNPSLRSFLKNKENRDKTALFMTAGDSDWKYSYLEVDAVTAASEIENMKGVYSEFEEKVDAILLNNSRRKTLSIDRLQR